MRVKKGDCVVNTSALVNELSERAFGFDGDVCLSTCKYNVRIDRGSGTYVGEGVQESHCAAGISNLTHIRA